MNIKESLRKILTYYLDTRRAGHTNAMILGAYRTPDVIVLAANHHHKKELQKEIPHAKVIAISDPDSLMGEDRLPLLMDNHTIWEICKSSLDMIENMERLTESLSRQLDEKHAKLQLTALQSEGRLYLLHQQEARHERDMKAVIEQRDKLAEACQDVADSGGNFSDLLSSANKCREALKSIKP